MPVDHWGFRSTFWKNAPESYNPDMTQLNLSCSQIIDLEVIAETIAIVSEHDDELTTQKTWYLTLRPGRKGTRRPKAVAGYLKLPKTK